MSDLGAVWVGKKRYRFRVWAPFSERVQLHILSPQECVMPMQHKRNGYHQATIEGLAQGSRYKYRLANGKELPDPVSRYQPEGVHGPSEVVDPRFDWQDQQWFGLPIENYIIYELHAGTFTEEG